MIKNKKNIPIYEISIPEYNVETPPDCGLIGHKIDQLLLSHFTDELLAIRCIGSCDHPGKTQDELIELIIKLGTDRYDKNRDGDRYSNIEGKRIDFFALERIIKPDYPIMEQFIYSMYHDSIRVGFDPIKIDIILLYYMEHVSPVIHTYEDGREKNDGYIFNNPNNKPEALAGLVKVV